MFRYVLLAALTVTAIAGVTNYRPYVATQLAKAIMLSDDVPDDDDNKKICDGSGYITHGDGHKTPCPGCSACTGSKPVAEPTSKVCKCGCNKAECSCVDGSCKKKGAVASHLVVYHFGAIWCDPCVQMKSRTWGNLPLRKFMEDKGVKLYFFDSDNPAHAKFFNYYNLSSRPTILVLRRDDLNHPKKSEVGFLDHKSFKAILRSELND